MNEVLKVLKERRSCRSYRPEQITDEELNAVLEAGTYAPTARGQQSPIIVAVQNPAVVEQLRKMNAAVLGTPEADPFYGAPTVLVVLAARDNTNRVYDGSCVMSNLMNAAKAVGLASCWVHRAKEVFDSEEGKALLRQWGVEGDYEGCPGRTKRHIAHFPYSPCHSHVRCCRTAQTSCPDPPIPTRYPYISGQP